MWNHKRQFGGKLPVRTLAQDYHDDLMRDQTAYALFCADLLNCQKLKVDVDDVNGDTAYYHILLLRSCPMLVERKEVGAAILSSVIGDGLGTARFSGDYAEAAYHHLVNKKSATVTNDYFISMWLAQTYGRQDEFKLNTTLGIMLDITNTTLTQREIWDRNKHIMFQAYAENDLPIFSPPIAGGIDSEYMGPEDVSGLPMHVNPTEVLNAGDFIDPDAEVLEEFDSLSETKWDQLVGYYTGYLDNLGIFLQHGYSLDHMFYMGELDKFPWEDLRRYAIVTRLLNSGEQENVDTFSSWFGSVPGIGSGAQAYTQVFTKRYRYYFPRVAAFDRQVEKLDEYNVYAQKARRMGAKLMSEVAGFEKFSMRLKIILTYQEWYDFLLPLFATNSVAWQWAPRQILNYLTTTQGGSDGRGYQKTFKDSRRNHRRYR